MSLETIFLFIYHYIHKPRQMLGKYLLSGWMNEWMSDFKVKTSHCNWPSPTFNWHRLNTSAHWVNSCSHQIISTLKASSKVWLEIWHTLKKCFRCLKFSPNSKNISPLPSLHVLQGALAEPCFAFPAFSRLQLIFRDHLGLVCKMLDPSCPGGEESASIDLTACLSKQMF